MRLAQGRWIGANADDDALLPGCIESLLALARQRHVEVTYGLLRFRHPDWPDEIVGDGPPPRCERWGLQASLFHAGLRFVPLLYTDWLFGVPNDWSWGERLLRIGVRFALLLVLLVDYYPLLRVEGSAAGGLTLVELGLVKLLRSRGARQPHLHRG